MRNILIGLTAAIAAVLTVIRLNLPDIKESEIEETVPEQIATVNESFTVAEDIDCLAINTYHEARDQSIAGQMAVMMVVLNRVNSPYFPNTICDVVTDGPTYVNWKGNTWPVRDKCQFSWYCDGMSDTATDVESYKRIKELAEYVAISDSYDYTEGSTHYHADYVKPEWRKELRRVVQIDSHIFYARF